MPDNNAQKKDISLDQQGIRDMLKAILQRNVKGAVTFDEDNNVKFNVSGSALSPQQQFGQALAAQGQPPSLEGVLDPQVLTQAAGIATEQQKMLPQTIGQLQRAQYENILAKTVPERIQGTRENRGISAAIQLLAETPEQRLGRETTLRDITSRGTLAAAQARAQIPTTQMKNFISGLADPRFKQHQLDLASASRDPLLSELRGQTIGAKVAQMESALEVGDPESRPYIPLVNEQIPDNSGHVWMWKEGFFGDKPNRYELPRGVTMGDVRKSAAERGVPVEQFISTILDQLEAMKK